MTAQSHRVYLAIGSNIAPHDNIRRCLGHLRTTQETRLLALSSCYRTSPWGMESQPDFVNLVAELSTDLAPLDLLRATQEIEQRLGRTRALENGPRTIDLDILLYDSLITDDAALQIPHPGLLLRDFMLVPLIEIAPEVLHPERRRPLKTLTGEIRYRQILEKRPLLAELEGGAPEGPAPDSSSSQVCG